MAETRRVVGDAAAPTGKRCSLADISNKGSGLPNRYVLFADVKWGKTSFAAETPRPLFLMTEGETGLLTLIEHKRVPAVSYLPEFLQWTALLDALKMLAEEEHDYRTLVLDTLNGAEHMCHNHVTQVDFEGKRAKFRGWGGQGYDVSLPEWKQLFVRLDTLREQRKMSVVCLAHQTIQNVRDPETADYTKWVPAMHEKSWEICNRWADTIMCGAFETVNSEQNPKLKGKATGTGRRSLLLGYSPARVSGDRLGLPSEIDMGDSAQEGWKNFVAALKAAKNGGDK